MHAIRSSRRLIIDTKNWGLCDEFSNYFETILPFSNIKTALTTQMGKDSIKSRATRTHSKESLTPTGLILVNRFPTLSIASQLSARA